MRKIYIMFLIIVLVLVTGIIVFDVNNYEDHSHGAGEIWWTEIEEENDNND